MLKISEQQAMDRWDTLTDSLREAVFDEHNADIIWKFGQQNHLSDEKTKQIAGVAGDVLMGFMRPDIDEVAREIQETAEIPKELATEFAELFYKKIFRELKSDLEKIYAPPKDERAKTHESSSTPQPVKINITTPKEQESERKETTKEIEPPANLPFASKDVKTENTNQEEIKGSIESQPEAGPPAAEKPPANNEAKPFLLHKEKPLFTPETPAEKPSVSFRPEAKSGNAPRQKPVSARVSLPVEKEDDSKRVVHYSDLSTKLDSNDKSQS